MDEDADVTIMGHVFHKMTDAERQPFLGSALDAFICYPDNNTILIYEPTGLLEPSLDIDNQPRITEFVSYDPDEEKEDYEIEWIMMEKRTG